MFQKQSPNYFLKEQITNHVPMVFAEPGRPDLLVASLLDLKSICAGYLGTLQTLQTFFRILNLSGVDKHSVFREQFWKAYLKGGYIDQAWIALAPGVSRLASEQLELKPHQYAKLQKSRRIDDRHAVLIMRLDQIYVAEWSHTGKCRFWFANNLHRPAMHQPQFAREDLTDHADYVQQHYFSSKGLWQKDAAAWMSARAQIPAFF